MGTKRLMFMTPSPADLFKPPWGSPIERERRRRILLTLWAYAYEFADNPMVSDRAFDAVALASRPTITTGHLDAWWRENFAPHTGQWIRAHPERDKIAMIYERLCQ